MGNPLRELETLDRLLTLEYAANEEMEGNFAQGSRKYELLCLSDLAYLFSRLPFIAKV